MKSHDEPVVERGCLSHPRRANGLIEVIRERPPLLEAFRIGHSGALPK